MLSRNLYDHDRTYLGTINVEFTLSGPLLIEMAQGGSRKYNKLYQYFWNLIELNKENCKTCHESRCYNRYFFKTIKEAKLTQNDLYVLAYIISYFLDLL